MIRLLNKKVTIQRKKIPVGAKNLSFEVKKKTFCDRLNKHKSGS